MSVGPRTSSKITIRWHLFGLDAGCLEFMADPVVPKKLVIE